MFYFINNNFFRYLLTPAWCNEMCYNVLIFLCVFFDNIFKHLIKTWALHLLRLLRLRGFCFNFKTILNGSLCYQQTRMENCVKAFYYYYLLEAILRLRRLFKRVRNHATFSFRRFHMIKCDHFTHRDCQPTIYKFIKNMENIWINVVY